MYSAVSVIVLLFAIATTTYADDDRWCRCFVEYRQLSDGKLLYRMPSSSHELDSCDSNGVNQCLERCNQVYPSVFEIVTSKREGYSVGRYYCGMVTKPTEDYEMKGSFTVCNKSEVFPYEFRSNKRYCCLLNEKGRFAFC